MQALQQLHFVNIFASSMFTAQALCRSGYLRTQTPTVYSSLFIICMESESCTKHNIGIKCLLLVFLSPAELRRKMI